ncbi:SRPBCC family protein [Halobacterium rubrum]|uniref:SRPBCC family protein n=1 Tax=Halobacterium TaxID=2239 RepID=UPI001F1644DE|nr:MULTISPECIES: SRPBCC family protein [Halobacterium]MDH5021034.1 SRPBCC family protein [Halobacterium rubrum]
MREVERTRRVGGTPAEVQRLLSPTTIVDWEGSFDVFDVQDAGSVAETAETAGDDGTVVTAGGTGVKLRLLFTELADGYRYEQLGNGGPFDEMTTRLTVEPQDEGALVTARSVVELGTRVPFADRIAAWKRGGELDRLLASIDAET